MLVGVGKIVHFPLATLSRFARKGKLLYLGNLFIGMFSQCRTNRLVGSLYAELLTKQLLPDILNSDFQLTTIY
jgi:hypothetical protein